ncbi:hypothetical protein F5Y16DRAFT_400657 [Xylariaceae sp. FL0255]|nr:hypothetical protein F5Y16DRAFT_400657 [Xylariaceae sp. FL0255]
MRFFIIFTVLSAFYGRGVSATKCICYKWNSYLDTIDAVDGATESCCQQVYHKAAKILDFTDAFCDVRNQTPGWSDCCESLGLQSSGSGGLC